MEATLAIAAVALAIALAAALFVIRRRTDERDALLARVTAAPAASAAPGGAGVRPEPIPPVDLGPIGIVHLGSDRRVARANERAHAILDIGPGRLVGRTVMETFLDLRVEALIDGVGEDAPASGEVRVGAGEPRTAQLSIRREAGGGTWIVLEDVTELRRLQQIRAEFIDNLSHELRTPLSTVSLLAETLVRDAAAADVPQKMRDRIGKVQVETGHLVQMVNELLDLARIEGGSALHPTDDVDLGALATASAERLRPFAERSGVALSVTTEPGLPPVRGDEERLGQVLVNLVHNAVKFSPDGGVVEITVRRDADIVVASVADHGIGIAKADRVRIFERFYKADRARTRGGGGTGLGLSIARHVVERHGGRIWVESEEGRGSTFSFSIPVASASTASAPSSALSPA